MDKRLDSGIEEVEIIEFREPSSQEQQFLELPSYQWNMKGITMIQSCVRGMAGPSWGSLDCWNKGMQLI